MRLFILLTIMLVVPFNSFAVDQKSFKSKKFGFSVNYPKGWEFEPILSDRQDGIDAEDSEYVEFVDPKCKEGSALCNFAVNVIFPSQDVKTYADYEKRLESNKTYANSDKNMYRMYEITHSDKSILIFIQNVSSIYHGTIEVSAKYRFNCDKTVIEISSGKKFKGTFSENFPANLKDVLPKAFRKDVLEVINSFKCSNKK